VWVWRQCVAWTKMSCTSYDLSTGARGGLDGGAHAHCEGHQSRGAGQIYDGRVSLGMREDQPGYVDPDDPRLEGGDCWRRYRVDEVWLRWPAVRYQSGIRILRCRAGHEYEVECQCHADCDQELYFYKLCDDAGWRCVVGRDDGRQAGRVDGLAAAAMDSGQRSQGGASQCAIYHSGQPVSGDRS